MKNQKHTPGPWTSNKLGPLAPQTTWRIFSENSKGEVRDTIVDIYGGDQIMKSDEESEANAQLIAAAPCMLEALELAIRCLAVAINKDTFKDCALPLIGEKTLIQCESAIKKARGES